MFAVERRTNRRCPFKSPLPTIHLALSGWGCAQSQPLLVELLSCTKPAQQQAEQTVTVWTWLMGGGGLTGLTGLTSLLKGIYYSCSGGGFSPGRLWKRYFFQAVQHEGLAQRNVEAVNELKWV